MAIIKFKSQPIHYAWDQARPGAEGHRFHELDFFIGSGSVNAALNFLIFVLVGHCCCILDHESIIDGEVAYTTSPTTSHYYQAANRVGSLLHISRLVCQDEAIRSLLIADFPYSVVLVSIVWVIVLSKLYQADVTCPSTSLAIFHHFLRY